MFGANVQSRARLDVTTIPAPGATAQCKKPARAGAWASAGAVKPAVAVKRAKGKNDESRSLMENSPSLAEISSALEGHIRPESDQSATRRVDPGLEGGLCQFGTLAFTTAVTKRQS
jgi:hypothetical protein